MELIANFRMEIDWFHMEKTGKRIKQIKILTLTKRDLFLFVQDQLQIQIKLHVLKRASRFFPVERCYEEAKKKGKRYFAVQFFGECWASDTTSYQKLGQSTNCWNGVGRDYDNYVYEVIF